MEVTVGSLVLGHAKSGRSIDWGHAGEPSPQQVGVTALSPPRSSLTHTHAHTPSGLSTLPTPVSFSAFLPASHLLFFLVRPLVIPVLFVFTLALPLTYVGRACLFFLVFVFLLRRLLFLSLIVSYIFTFFYSLFMSFLLTYFYLTLNSHLFFSWLCFIFPLFVIR